MNFIPIVARFISKFNFDILFNIIENLDAKDRRGLLSRLLRNESDRNSLFRKEVLIRILDSYITNEDSELEIKGDNISFVRNNIKWSGKAYDESVLKHLFINGHFQLVELDALLNYLRKTSISINGNNFILDIGANIGSTTIPLAMKTIATIIAIEPISVNFADLERNIIQNSLEKRVKRLKVAIHSRLTGLKMNITKNLGGSHIHNKLADEEQIQQIGIWSNEVIDIEEVRGIGLDTLLKEERIDPKKVSFVWCDVEGSECHIIESGASLWENYVPLYVEVNIPALRYSNNLDHFISLASRFFSNFITSKDLILNTENAQKPIDLLNKFLLDKPDDFVSDILLI